MRAIADAPVHVLRRFAWHVLDAIYRVERDVQLDDGSVREDDALWAPDAPWDGSELREDIDRAAREAGLAPRGETEVQAEPGRRLARKVSP